MDESSEMRPIPASAPPRDDEPDRRLSELWRQGRRPDLRMFLDRLGELTPRQLAAVLRVDQRERWEIGQPISATQYLQDYPALSADTEAAIELVYGEFLLREDLGEAPSLDDYLRCHPRYAERLRQQVELHRVLASSCQLTLNREASTTAPIHPHRPAPRWPKVSGYEILGELGRGGMGVVYEAHQLGLKRRVALKMIRAGAHARAEELGRFRLEAEAVARLQHPHIVQIYEIGDQDGCPYFSLELASGGSLAKRLRGTPQPPLAAAQMVRTLALAMHTAHERGIVHRDLKPANVLLMSDGTPKITDFGLAKQLDIEVGLSHSGEIKGTPSYMAPEQAEGKTKEIGPLADVYALGAILYEMLTGRPPFQAATREAMIVQLLGYEPVPPRRLQAKLPRDLETICLKCLQKEPRGRYASAAALAEDLRRFVEGVPIEARPIGVCTRAIKWARRRPAVAGLVAVSMVAVLSSVAGGLLYILYQGQEQDRLRRMFEGQGLFLQGQTNFAAGDWRNATLHLAAALAKISSEPSLAHLKAQAERLKEEAERRLDEEARRHVGQVARQEARERYEKFKKLRDDAFFQQTLFTGEDQATNIEATKVAATAALDLFGVTLDSAAPPATSDAYFDGAETAEINAGCYELLLSLAEAEAHPSSYRTSEEGRHGAGNALRILDRAARLGLITKAYHQRRARYLAQSGDEPAAREERERAEALRPATAADFFLLGTELTTWSNPRLAIREFDNALRQQPDHFWAQYGQAACYLRLQQWVAAKVSLTACLGRRPGFAWLYPLRALALGELGELEDAEADFRKAEGFQADEPTRYSLYVGRGVLRIRQGKFDAAVADLQAAIALRPGLYHAYVNLAQAYQRQGKRDEAVKLLDQAIQRASSLAPLYRERARLHLQRNEATLSLRDLERAIRLEPAGRPPRALAADHAERGQILHRGGKYQEAVRAYDAALEIRPDYAVVHHRRAQALLRLAEVDADQGRNRERFKESVLSLGLSLQVETTRADIYRTRGLVRAKLGDYAGAVDDYTRALGIEPDAATHAARGWIYSAVFEAPALALRDFDEVIRLDPKENGDAYNGRGAARLQLGQDPEAAIADAEEALRRGPEKPRLFYNAARIFAQAVGSLDARTTRREHQPGRRNEYQARALQLLHQALDRLPVEQRASFWRTISPDAALNPIRRSRGFVQMEAEHSESANQKNRLHQK